MKEYQDAPTDSEMERMDALLATYKYLQENMPDDADPMQGKFIIVNTITRKPCVMRFCKPLTSPRNLPS